MSDDSPCIRVSKGVVSGRGSWRRSRHDTPNAEHYELFTGHLSKGNLCLYRRLGYAEIRSETVSPRLRLVYLEKLRYAS